MCEKDDSQGESQNRRGNAVVRGNDFANHVLSPKMPCIAARTPPVTQPPRIIDAICLYKDSLYRGNKLEKNESLDRWQAGRYSLAEIHGGQNFRDAVSSSADGCRG